MAVYLLNLHDNGQESWQSKNIIYWSSMTYQSWNHVPKTNRFPNRPSEFDKFLPLRMNSFLPLGLSDKLLIAGHGSTDGFGPYCRGGSSQQNAIDLATDLKRWGLISCGVISFKACFLGAGDFLSDLLMALMAREVDFGWLKGYTGESQTRQAYGLIGKPRERIIKKVNPISSAPQGDMTRYRVLLLKGPSHADVPRPNTHGELEI